MACCESLAGRTTDALGHLGQALDTSESFREPARTDSDFDPIRNDPAFQDLIGQ